MSIAQSGPTTAVVDRIGIGVAAAFVAMFLYGATETLAKWLTEAYDPTQILLVRAFFALGVAAALARLGGGGGWSVLRTAQPWTQALRGLCGAGCMVLALFAYAELPLAEATSIVYAAPILVTVLAVPMLGERLGVRRVVAVGVGFLGVVLVVRPGAGVLQPAALLALAAMALYAVSNVLTRKLGRTDRGVTTLIYTQLCFIALCLPAQPFVWATPDIDAAPLFFLIGLGGATAQYLMTLAYRDAPAAVIAPFDYMTILWATVFAFLVWGEAPAALTWVGMALIILSGSYIALRELVISPPRNTGPVHLWARRRPS